MEGQESLDDTQTALFHRILNYTQFIESKQLQNNFDFADLKTELTLVAEKISHNHTTNKTLHLDPTGPNVTLLNTTLVNTTLVTPNLATP